MRTILIVIDALGVGAMEDIINDRKQDIGAHTYESIKKHNGTNYKNLQRLGIEDLERIIEPYGSLNIRIGKSKLFYKGADSYHGHKEIIGSIVSFNKTYISFIKDILIDLFKNESIRRLTEEIMVINNGIYITNNIESDVGTNINVVGNLDLFTFDQVLAVGQRIRKSIRASRVITMGGVPLSDEIILKATEEKYDNEDNKFHLGVNIGKTGIYNEKYKVIHLGLGDTRNDNLIRRFLDNNLPLSLIGKTADLFGKMGGKSMSIVDTKKVIENLDSTIDSQREGLIFVNVQELDLAGHEQRADKAGNVLSLVDEYLPTLLNKLKLEDILILTADHGNDPLIGHPMHTREYTPIIAIGQTIKNGNIGVRSSLADIAASICDYHGLDSPESGETFL